ncbi:hypothetical protein KQH82_01650 [bacterium]|nr:hypothetical protein [bacterium]
MNSSDLLHIRILPIEQIYPFEQTTVSDDAPSDEDLRFVRDPFPVTELNEDGFLLLQDTDRFNVLLRAGLLHVPAQIVAEPALRLVSEKLALPWLSRDTLSDIAVRHPDEIIPISEGAEIPEGFVSVSFQFPDCDPQTVLLRYDAKVGCPDGLRLLFDEFSTLGRYAPVVKDSGRADQLLKPSSSATTLTLPGFSLADLRMAAASEDLFPANLIRVVPELRVIAIDFPVSVLTSDIPIGDKQSFLHELISLREQANRTSMVEGRVYILNR